MFTQVRSQIALHNVKRSNLCSLKRPAQYCAHSLERLNTKCCAQICAHWLPLTHGAHCLQLKTLEVANCVSLKLQTHCTHCKHFKININVPCAAIHKALRLKIAVFRSNYLSFLSFLQIHCTCAKLEFFLSFSSSP